MKNLSILAGILVVLLAGCMGQAPGPTQGQVLDPTLQELGLALNELKSVHGDALKVIGEAYRATEDGSHTEYIGQLELQYSNIDSSLQKLGEALEKLESEDYALLRTNVLQKMRNYGANIEEGGIFLNQLPDASSDDEWQEARDSLGSLRSQFLAAEKEIEDTIALTNAFAEGEPTEDNGAGNAQSEIPQFPE